MIDVQRYIKIYKIRRTTKKMKDAREKSIDKIGFCNAQWCDLILNSHCMGKAVREASTWVLHNNKTTDKIPGCVEH